jgi:trehalose utilization protein
MPIQCTVWGEAIHELESPLVASIYPAGMHTTIADALHADPSISARTTTLQDAEQGCSAELLAPCANVR